MTLTGVQLDSFILNHRIFAEACNRYGIPRYENREPDNNTMALYKGYLACVKTGILLASGYKVGLYAGGGYDMCGSELVLTLNELCIQGVVSADVVQHNFHDKDLPALQEMIRQYMAAYGHEERNNDQA